MGMRGVVRSNGPSVQGTAHLAEEFGTHPDVFCDLGLGDALRDLRIVVDESRITLNGRMGYRCAPAALQVGEVALQEQPEEALELWYAGEQLVLAAMIEQQQLAVFQRFDEHIGRELVVKTLRIADPAAFDGEAEIGLAAVLIDVVATYATLYDERLKTADVAFL